MSKMIDADQIRFRYDPEVDNWAVDGASLKVENGEFVALLGADGERA